MALIDSHAHLTYEPLYSSVEAVLDRASAAGVEAVISIGTDLQDAVRVLDLARRDPRVHAAFGLHPHQAGKVGEEDWDRYRRLLAESSPVALGEMGLDYHYDFADRATQRSVLERQLELAKPTNKPIIIHAREAHDDVVATLKNAGFVGRRVVFHCFTGTVQEAGQIADHGWRVSFTGVITFKNAGEVQQIAAEYPLDQLMLETDSPYLSPVPVRHVRPNEPAHVAHVARFLAERRGLAYDDLVDRTAENTRTFFDW